MRLCFYAPIKNARNEYVFQSYSKMKRFLVKKHSTLAGTRLGCTRRSRRGGVDDGSREGLRLCRDDDGDVDVACLCHLLACDGYGAGSNGRGELR